jgi:methyltransferase (TIGR00027 family)
MRRAAHQIIDHPKIFDDPIALAIIGPVEGAALRSSIGRLDNLPSRYLRAFIVVRSRYAEDELAKAVARGARQCVILGAGLDTFAYRNPYAESALRVFEVDHPSTQTWKQERLAAASIAIPPSVQFAPVDFERQTLAEGLLQAGFDPKKITFFSWLGVTPYLTRKAVMSTFEFIVTTPRGGGVVCDYGVPRESLNLTQKLAFDVIANRVAAAGEPFQTFFDTAALTAELTRIGFSRIEDLAQEEINARYFKDRADKLRIGGGLGHLLSAEI